MIDIYSNITLDLIKWLLELRKSKKEEELEEPEWQLLEKAYLKHLEWRFKYPEKVFGQQLIATSLITTLVILLVIAGIVFSFFQLYTAIKLGDLTSLNTEMAIETAGKLSISSSLVGASVLIISLVFFYLYLKHVFQIQHPVPPHVSLGDKDGIEMLEKLKTRRDKSKLEKEDEE